MNFDSENSCKNEFKDNNEKSCSWSRNRVSHKMEFKAVWPRNGHADSVGVNWFRVLFIHQNQKFLKLTKPVAVLESNIFQIKFLRQIFLFRKYKLRKSAFFKIFANFLVSVRQGSLNRNATRTRDSLLLNAFMIHFSTFAGNELFEAAKLLFEV